LDSAFGVLDGPWRVFYLLSFAFALLSGLSFRSSLDSASADYFSSLAFNFLHSASGLLGLIAVFRYDQPSAIDADLVLSLSWICFVWALSSQILFCRVHSSGQRMQFTAIAAVTGWLVFSPLFTSAGAADSLAFGSAAPAIFLILLLSLVVELFKAAAQLLAEMSGNNSLLYLLCSLVFLLTASASVPLFSFATFNRPTWAWVAQGAAPLSILEAAVCSASLFGLMAASIKDFDAWKRNC
jgi:hypothetical protein